MDGDLPLLPTAEIARKPARHLAAQLSVFTSSIVAKKALVDMELLLDDAATYEEIRRIEAGAQVLRQLYQHVDEVRQQAERTIVIACERVGEELRELPVAKAGRPPLNRPAESADLAPTLAQQVGSKNRGLRLKKLAEAGRDKVRETIEILHNAGKEASVTAVLKALHGDDKRERRAEREGALAERIRAASASLGEGSKLYGVIYADPPWQWQPYSRETGMDRAADNHYPTMRTEEIMSLKVPAADDCILFLWSTNPMLPDALDVMYEWGFVYKSQFVWVKDKIGPGYWNREKHETLLVGTRGEIPCPAPGDQYDSVIEGERGEHSRKPFVVHEMIEEMFPSLPRLEMFSRGGGGECPPGWDVWGAEAPTEEAA